MSRLSTHPELARWSRELPLPLARSLDRVREAKRGPPEDALYAGLDAYRAASMWCALVAVADTVAKIRASAPVVGEKRFAPLMRAIRRLLRPRQLDGHWHEVLRSAISAYGSQPDDFFVPELVRARADIVAWLPQGLRIRNLSQHRCNPSLSARQATEYGAVVDEALVGFFEHLACFAGYTLVQFDSPPEAAANGWYRFASHLRLRGADTSFGNIGVEEQAEFVFEEAPPAQGALYLFNPGRRRHVALHPFAVFDPPGRLGDPRHTYLFDHLDGESLRFFCIEKGDTIAVTTADEIPDDPETSRPIHGYIEGMVEVVTGLDAATSLTELEWLRVTPPPSERSFVLDFSRYVEFHVDGFVGRLDALEQVADSLPRARTIWVRGAEGMGKSAFLSKLAKNHPHSIAYFISSERNTADATTFLLHLCQSLADHFALEDTRLDPRRGYDRSQLLRMLEELLQRAQHELDQRREHLLLLVDGIDESQRYASTHNERISNVLPRASELLPDRVTLVVSSRPDVELASIASTQIELGPFSETQIAALLSPHGWSVMQSRIAFERSGGVPLYFRFLLDGIRAGTFDPEAVRAMPAGMQGVYQLVWSRWEQSDPGGPTPVADAAMQVTGLLGAAQEPLTPSDLEQLVTPRESWKKLGFSEAETRRRLVALALDQSNLGRFVIGGTHVSLFHDSLRQFVLGRPSADGGRALHARLADWCAEHPDRPYSERHHTHHLLHAGRHWDLVGLFAATSEQGNFRLGLRRNDAGARLSRELAHATRAAMAEGDLADIFRIAMLRWTLDAFLGSGRIEDSGALLADIGELPTLEAMVDASSTPLDRWPLCVVGYAGALSNRDRLAASGWIQHIRSVWSSITDRFDRVVRASELIEAVGDLAPLPETLLLVHGLDELERAAALRTAAMRSDPVRRRELAQAVAAKYARVPGGISLGAVVFDDDPALGWTLFERGLAARSDLADGMLDRFLEDAGSLGVFLRDDLGRTLPAMVPPALTTWREVRAFLRALGVVYYCSGPSAVARFLPGLAPDAELLARAYLHFRGSNASGRLDAWLAAATLPSGAAACNPLLAATCLVRAASLSRDAPDPLGDPLGEALIRMIADHSRTPAFPVDREALVLALHRWIDRAMPLAKQLRDDLGSTNRAILFAMSTLAPSVGGRTPRTESIAQAFLGNRPRHPHWGPLIEATEAAFIEACGVHDDIGDRGALVLPVLMGLLDRVDAAGTVEALSPFDRLEPMDSVPFPIVPGEEVGVDQVARYLVDSQGRPLLDEFVLGEYVHFHAAHAPRQAREFHTHYRAWLTTAREVGPDTLEDDPTAVIDTRRVAVPPRHDDGLPDQISEWWGSEELWEGAPLARMLVDLGEPADGWAIAMGTANAELWWQLAPSVEREPERFLKLVARRGGAQPFWSAGAPVERLIERCLRELEPEAQREWLQLVLANQSHSVAASRVIQRLAGRNGHADLALRTYRENPELAEHPSLVQSFVLGRIEAVAGWLPERAAAMFRTCQEALRERGLEVVEQIEQTFDHAVADSIAKRPGSWSPHEALDASLPEFLGHTRIALLAEGLRRDGTHGDDAASLLEVEARPSELEDRIAFVDAGAALRFCRDLADPVLWSRLIPIVTRFVVQRITDDASAAEADSLVPLLSSRWVAAEERERSQRAFLGVLQRARALPDERATARDVLAFARGMWFESHTDPETVDRVYFGRRALVESTIRMAPRDAWSVLRARPEDGRQRAAIRWVELVGQQEALFALDEVLPQVPLWGLGRALLHIGAFVPGSDEDVRRRIEPHLERLTSVPRRDDGWASNQVDTDEHAVERLWSDHRPLARSIVEAMDDPAWEFGHWLTSSRFGERRSVFEQVVEERWEPWRARLRFEVEHSGIGAAATWPIAKAVTTLATDGSDLAARLLEELMETVVYGEDGGVEFGRALTALAKVRPELAWRWLNEQRRTSMSCHEVVEAFLAEHPERASEAAWLLDVEGFVYKARARLMAEYELAAALSMAEEKSLHTAEFVRQFAAHGAVDFEGLLSLARWGDVALVEVLAASLANPRLSDDAREQAIDLGVSSVGDLTFEPSVWSDVAEVSEVRDDGERLSVRSVSALYAAAPDRFESVLRQRAAPLDEPLASKVMGWLNKVRLEAVPTLAEWAPEFLFANLDEWSRQPWWQPGLEGGIPLLDPPQALRLAAYGWMKPTPDAVRGILARARDADEVRACLRELLSEYVSRHPDALVEVLTICVEYADEAAQDAMTLIAGLAEAFGQVQQLSGAERWNFDDLVERLEAIADGRAQDTGDSEEARRSFLEARIAEGEEHGRAGYVAILRGVLTTELRRHGDRIGS